MPSQLTSAAAATTTSTATPTSLVAGPHSSTRVVKDVGNTCADL
jgi:hypothetical protein